MQTSLKENFIKMNLLCTEHATMGSPLLLSFFRFVSFSFCLVSFLLGLLLKASRILNLLKRFEVLTKCSNKFGCLVNRDAFYKF